MCQNEDICVVQPSLTYRLQGVNGPVSSDDDEKWAEAVLHPEKVEVEFSGSVEDTEGERGRSAGLV